MDLSQVLAVLLPLAFIIYWLTDLAKDVTNKNVNGIVTKLVSLAAAYLVVWLFANSDVNLGGAGNNARELMATWAWQSLLLVALAIAAGGGTFADYLRARNPNDASVAPTMLPSAAPPVVVTTGDDSNTEAVV